MFNGYNKKIVCYYHEEEEKQYSIKLTDINKKELLDKRIYY